VLIRGESGTGKELVARALHQHSGRANRPFVPINCAALPENLVESELFGHEQGAFTGAARQRIGKFEAADEGTLFLDEIGDMPLMVQAKMLRLLQDQHFERLGGNHAVQTRVRILAATNQDLEKLIAAGRFRSDLYYRLRVVTLHVPPLRHRGDDVIELAHYLLSVYNKELGLAFHGFAPETLDVFRAYDWPGNVRELQCAIKEAMLQGSGPVVFPEFLPSSLFGPHPPPVSTLNGQGLDLDELIARAVRDCKGEVYDEVTRVVERYLIARVLKQTRGHQAQASELLGITRTTLRNKLRELGIAVDKVVSAETAEGVE
jgi:two-component system nitrogen regulation response regulator GlnG